ncbi:MAG TPA: hypothetical protein VJ969_08560 [Desulfopila sp.]|nr:hypothetical protein [Desulfopila sp.]
MTGGHNQINKSSINTTLAVGLIITSGVLMGALTYDDGGIFRLHQLKTILWTIPLWGAGAVLLWYREKPGFRFHAVHSAVIALLVYVFMRASSAGDFYYLHWLSAADDGFGQSWSERVFLFGGVALLALATHKGRLLKWLLLLAVIFLQVAAFRALFEVTGGEPIYRVDHPSFFFRLWSYAQSMPRFIFYDPFWNGGKVMPYLVASGVTAPGIFLWPIWRFLPTATAYTPAFGLLFIIVVPLLAVFATRLITRDRSAWIAAALMSLGTSHFYFVHLVHYGTFGSLFAASFLMPFTACLYRLVVLRRKDALSWIVLTLSAFLALSWPATVAMAPVFVLVLLLNRHRLSRSTVFGFLLCGTILFIALAPYALSIIVHSDLGGLARTHPTFTFGDAWVMGCTVLARLLRQSHPVILFLGIIALLVLPERRLGRWFLPLLLASLILASWGKGWKEALQLDRVWINALFIGILPASWTYGWLSRRRDWASLLATSFVSGLLVMGGYSMVKYMGNEGRADFRIMSQEMKAIVSWIDDNVPEGGRVLFAGVASHGYGGGKVAALPVFTGREMMAADYYGFSPKLVEYAYPPREFRKFGPEKLMDFFELYNVTHVITYHEDWKRVFRRHNDHYVEEVSFRQKTIFRVLRDSNMFLQGSGQLSVSLNSIIIEPAEADEEVVIKYNWAEGLEASPATAHIEPYDTGTSVKLIRIDPNGASRISLSYSRWY